MQRVAVVTGAASGIGLCVAEQLATSGAQVIATDMNVMALDDLRMKWASERRSIDVAELDVSDVAGSIEPTFAEMHRRYGRIDILVNCAGICPRTPLESTAEQEWDRVMAVNLKGTFFCCKAVAPIMIGQRFGRIINISSAAGQQGGIAVGMHYSSSKAGVICLTKSLAKHMARHGVTVNSVSPGTTDSNMTRSWPAEVVERVISQIPLGRLAQPDEIARAVAFLASDEAGYITGHTLCVNGGMVMA